MSKRLRGSVVTAVALVATMLLINDSRYWHSDWSQFLPDAIVALLTGATVGLVVLGFQRDVEARAERRAQALRWAAVREQLARATAGTSDFTFIPHSAEAVGFDNTRITQVTSGVPVQAWRDNLTDDTLSLLVLYLDCLSSTQKSAGLLDAALTSAISAEPDLPIVPLREVNVRRSVLDWIDVVGHRNCESVDPLDQAAVASILSDSYVNHTGLTWRSDVMALTFAYESLREALSPGTFRSGDPY